MSYLRLIQQKMGAALAALLLVGCSAPAATPTPFPPMPTATPYSSTLPDAGDDSVLFATIQQIEEGPYIEGHETMLITIDRGSRDGVFGELIGYVQVHEIAVSEFLVQSVSYETATMLGWYYPTIEVGDRVVLITGHVSAREVLEYFAGELPTPPPVAVSSERYVEILNLYYPEYLKSNISGMREIAVRYRDSMPQITSNLLALADEVARSHITRDMSFKWSNGDLLGFSTLVGISVSIHAVCEKAFGQGTIEDDTVLAEIAINAREVALEKEESQEYSVALDKLMGAVEVSRYIVFDAPYNPLEVVFLEDIARIYDKMGDYELSEFFHEEADRLKRGDEPAN